MIARMPTGANKPKRQGASHDFTVTARRVVEQAIGERLDGSPLAPRTPKRARGGVKGCKAAGGNVRHCNGRVSKSAQIRKLTKMLGILINDKHNGQLGTE